MKLITKAVAKSLPMLRSTERTTDPTVRVKFFDPTSQWTWFATEAGAELADGRTVPLSSPEAAQAEDVTFFGMVHGFANELGYFSLNELLKIRGRFGLPIERDLYFTPCPLSQAR